MIWCAVLPLIYSKICHALWHCMSSSNQNWCDSTVLSSFPANIKCGDVQEIYPSLSNFDQRICSAITLFSALLNSHFAFLDIFTSIDFSFAMLIVHNIILVFNLQGFEMHFAILKERISHAFLNCVDVN